MPPADKPAERMPAAAAPGGLLSAISRSRAAMGPPPAGAPFLPAPPPQGPPEPALTVEPSPSVTDVGGRRDVIVRALVRSGSPLEEIGLDVGDAAVGQILLPADAASDPAPGEVLVEHLAMQAPSLGASADLAAAAPFRIVARRRDGSSAEGSGLIALAGGARASIVGVPAEPPGAPLDFRPRVMLFLERATVDPAGTLAVRGWAVGRAPVATVQVLADGRPVGAARLGLPRPDVGSVFPGYQGAGLSGFAFTAALGEAGRRIGHVAAQAITRAGASQTAVLPAERASGLAPPAPRPAPPARLTLGLPPPGEARRIHLFCNRAEADPDGRVRARGWAYCPAGLDAVTLLLDGRPAGELAAGPGFVAEIGLDASSGGRRLLIRARNLAGDEAELEADVTAPGAAGEDAEPDIRLSLDSPSAPGDGLPARVGGALEIRGWALARAGVRSVTALLDGAALGPVALGLPRPDVRSAHAAWPGALDSGFSLIASMKGVAAGAHALRVVVTDQDGGAREQAVALLVEKPYAELRTRLSLAEESLRRDVAARLGAIGIIALVMRLPGAPDAAGRTAMERTLASLRAQTRAAWHLTALADAPAETQAWRAWIARACPDLTPRVAIADRRDPRPVARPLAVGDGLAPAAVPPDLVGVLGPGDVLGRDALSEIAAARALHPDAGLLYADDIRVNPASGASEPFFKPDWSPELLLAANYIGRPWFADPSAIPPERAGLDTFLADGDYDALLRASERARSVRHVPRLLAERGADAGDSPETERAALAAAAARAGFAGIAPPEGLVSVIVPTCGARGLIEPCIASLRRSAAPGRIEIVAIDTIPEDEPELKAWLARNVDHVVSAPGPFNWSRLNNEGARRARGDYLLFLNDDVTDGEPGWLDRLLALAAKPDIGIAGPRLLYPDRTVQHAGMFLARTGLARHAFRGLDADDPGYFGLARTTRDVTAVTGACMLMRRAVFDALGGFDERHAIINNDLDFCLRAREAGLRIVCCADATLTHREGASRKALPETYAEDAFAARWAATFAGGDPFHNSNLARETDDFAPDEEPVRAVRAAYPLFRRDDIRRILAVKLDHIGDVVTALPALRSLRALFPSAHVTVLAGRFARALAEAEPAADSFIAFDFYNARSQDGPIRLDPSDYAALRARLAPHRFDLAVDLRKHPDTRDVLRHVPATWRAGYDQGGRFPFLDVALEWGADRPLQPKRTHVGEDLVALIDAVARACRPEPPMPPLAAPDLAAIRALLPPEVAALWSRPVVALHPGVGNVMRQWPEGHFADLLDLLTLRNGVSVVLIGGADEAALAARILGRAVRPDRAASLAGRTSLADLERILPHCALFVGNNSGPHHIAAALGVPTIGVHSGVVDPAEWAPAGPRAIALAKRMSCGPCYLAEPSQCPRGLACLTQLSPAIVHGYAEALMGIPAPV